MEDVQRVVETYKAGPLHKFSLHNIYHPWVSWISFLLFFVYFTKKKLGGHMSFHGATDTLVLDFWRRLLWVSKPEWAALFTLGRVACDEHLM